MLAKGPDPFVSKVGLASRRTALRPRFDKGFRSRVGWQPSVVGKGPGRLGRQRSGQAFFANGAGRFAANRPDSWADKSPVPRGGVQRFFNATSTQLQPSAAAACVMLEAWTCDRVRNVGKLLKPDACGRSVGRGACGACGTNAASPFEWPMVTRPGIYAVVYLDGDWCRSVDRASRSRSGRASTSCGLRSESRSRR